jgi:hypothetical protein
MRTCIFTLCAIIVVAFSSCDKGDMEIKKLNKGEGIWAIESMVIETYDSTGVNRIASMEQTNIGEFVFFQNTTLNALYDEHFVTALIEDTTGVTTGYTGGVYYDDSRVKIDCDPQPPVFNGYTSLNGVWTVEDNGRKKQMWTMYILDNNATLHEKYILEISRK